MQLIHDMEDLSDVKFSKSNKKRSKRVRKVKGNANGSCKRSNANGSRTTNLDCQTSTYIQSKIPSHIVKKISEPVRIPTIPIIHRKVLKERTRVMRKFNKPPESVARIFKTLKKPPLPLKPLTVPSKKDYQRKQNSQAEGNDPSGG